jgi:hypothetical protein
MLWITLSNIHSLFPMRGLHVLSQIAFTAPFLAVCKEKHG